MSEQIDVSDNSAIQNPSKVRSCFIRLLRDREIDERTRKKYKKNEKDVIRYFSYVFIDIVLHLAILSGLHECCD